MSYRHGDTSLVRDARNQDFMLDVKKQYGPSLFASRATFEQIFGQAVQTDPGLHTTGGILDLLTLLAQSAGKPVRQVPFQVNLLTTYDTATPQQIHATVNAFLHGHPNAPKRHTAAEAHALRSLRNRARLALTPTPSAAISNAFSAAPRLPFPLEYPRLRDQYASADADDLHLYSIPDQEGHSHHAYVVVISRGLIGQYYDVQGMDWTSAPMFASPDQTVQVGSRTYQLYYEGSNLRMVAWREYGAIYWVRNTLTDDVPNSAMLAMAEQTYPVGGHVSAPSPRRTALGAVGLLAKPTAAAPMGALRTYGPLAAVLAWLATAFLAARLLAGRRELTLLRGQVALAVAADARQRALVATDRGLDGHPAQGVGFATANRHAHPRRLAAALAVGLVATAFAGAYLVATRSTGSRPASHPGASS